jgi:PKD domain-containing protein
MKRMIAIIHFALPRYLTILSGLALMGLSFSLFPSLNAQEQSVAAFSLRIEGNNRICINQPITFRAETDLGTGFSWTVGKGNILSGENSNTVTIQWSSGVRRDTLRVTASSVAGEVQTAFLIIEVFGIARPIISSDGPTTFCVGSFVVLMAPSGYAKYLWSNGATSKNITVTDQGTFSVSVESVEGCTATSYPLKVNVLIPPKVQIAALGPTIFCDGDLVVLDAGDGYVGYRWSNGSGGRFLTVREGGDYSVTVKDIYGCEARSGPIRITVLQSQPKPDVSQSGTKLVTSPGAFFQWFLDADPIPGATSREFIPRTSGLYSVRVSNLAGCSALSEPFRFHYSGMTIAVPHLEAEASGPVQIPLVIQDFENLEDVTLTTFTSRLRFNTNILYPQDILSTLSGEWRTVELTGSYTPGDSVLGFFNALPIWTDFAETEIIIESFAWASDNVFVETVDGSMKVLLCEEGGTRLFVQNGPIALHQNHPNPFNASTSIEYSVIENGRTLLSVYSTLGQRVATLVDDNIEPGTYRVAFDASALPSGLYIYVLLTPTERITKFMELVK